MNLRTLPTLQEREDRYFRRVLALCGGRVTTAARVLGIGRATAYRKLRDLPATSKIEEPRLICPMCGDYVREPSKSGGRLTWDCRGACNP